MDLSERQIAGALRSAIDAHGPITHAWTGSAAKRVLRAVLSNEAPSRPKGEEDIKAEDLRAEVERLRRENAQFEREIAWLTDLAFPAVDEASR